MSKQMTKTENTDNNIEALEQREWMVPTVDIYESEQELLLVADVPGVDEKSIELRLDRSELTLEATRRETTLGNALGRECNDLGFKRVFTLPSGIDGSQIAAELKHGVLQVHLPKSAELRPRRINVTAL
jgi:HSP20 family protein